MKQKLWLTLIGCIAYCIDKELYKAIDYLREQVRVLVEQQEKQNAKKVEQRFAEGRKFAGRQTCCRCQKIYSEGKCRHWRTGSEFFVHSLIAPFEHGEAGFFGVAHRERLGDRRRVDARDDLANGVLAQRTGNQGSAIDGAAEFKSASTNTTGPFRILGFFRAIFVDRHLGGADRVVSVPRHRERIPCQLTS